MLGSYARKKRSSSMFLELFCETIVSSVMLNWEMMDDSRRIRFFKVSDPMFLSLFHRLHLR